MSHARAGLHGGVLLPLGSDHVEVVYDETQTRLVTYFFGADATTTKAIAVATFSAQLKSAADGVFEDLTFTPLPLEGETAERCSRFASSTLALKTDFEIVVRLKTGDSAARAHAVLDPGAVAVNKFVCPMNCFAGKTYAQPGVCPQCSMKLVEALSSAQPHSDHRPRHGGVFFMSADNWHHLEGVFAPPDEFRLYLYDNFTRPMDTGGFEADVEFAHKTDAEAPLKQKVLPAGNRAYLSAKVPADAAIPLRAAVRIKLKSDQPELFNFTFAPRSPPAR